MKQIRTVTGNISESEVGVVIPHEHICCYSEYLYQMAGDRYFNKEDIFRYSVNFLKFMKDKYNLSTYVDCTPVNIGRDVDLLKRVSNETGINIICSTGFYYTEESVLRNTSDDEIAEYMIQDAINVNAGVIKCAVEKEEISPYLEKILRSCAKAQLKLGLPIIMHTNARNRNGVKALDIILSEGVKPSAVTVGHLSDTEDVDYMKYFAEIGTYVALDRLHLNTTEEYVAKKVYAINKLAESGYDNEILLSHDSLFFNGFNGENRVFETPRLNYVFDYILPQLSDDLARKIMEQNPLNMLMVDR